MASFGTIEKSNIAGYVNSGATTSHQKRIERDEEELRQLEAAARGETTEPQEEEVEQPEQEVKQEAVEKEEKLSPEEKTYKKRYGDLRVHLNAMTEKVKALEAQMENGTAAVKPPKSEEDVRAWMDEYPDVAAIVEAIAEKKASERFAGAEERLSRIDAITADVERKKVESAIRSEHSDFDEIRESDEFHDWVAKQSKRTQDAVYENEDDAQAVIEVIDLYKIKTGKDAKATKQKAKDAASSVITKRGRIDVDSDGASLKIKESAVNKMSMKEYEAKADEIMEAIRTGNFIYDLSGGAR